MTDIDTIRTRIRSVRPTTLDALKLQKSKLTKLAQLRRKLNKRNFNKKRDKLMKARMKKETISNHIAKKGNTQRSRRRDLHSLVAKIRTRMKLSKSETQANSNPKNNYKLFKNKMDNSMKLHNKIKDLKKLFVFTI